MTHHLNVSGVVITSKKYSTKYAPRLTYLTLPNTLKIHNLQVYLPEHYIISFVYLSKMVAPLSMEIMFDSFILLGK